MAYTIKLLDESSLAPRPGDAGVLLFLRMSDTGYRGRGIVVDASGRPLREGVRVIGTCPVAATQDLYLACTSSGWRVESVGVAADSEFRTDQIMRGGQPVQAMDWSSDHRSVLDILAASFGPPASKPAPAPEPPRQAAAQRALPAPPRALPPPPAPERQPDARPPSRRLEGLGDDEQTLMMALAAAARRVKSGDSAADVISSLGEALSPLVEQEVEELSDSDDDDDDLDEDVEDDLDGEDIDEDVEEDEEDEVDPDSTSDAVASSAQAPQAPVQDVPVRPMRVLMPGEVPPGLTPEQLAQFSGYSDPAAEDKMRRSMERAARASAHARTIAEINARRSSDPAPSAGAAQAPPSAPPARPAQPQPRPQPRPQPQPQPQPQLQPQPQPQPQIEASAVVDPVVPVVDPLNPVLPPPPAEASIRLSSSVLDAPMVLFGRSWFTVEQIASAMGVTTATVRNKIKSLDCVIRARIAGARGVPRLLIPVEAVTT